MTAGRQPQQQLARRVHRQRRIIERPRLIKLLDEAQARTILLLAPAGYGKTTLARQWVKTLTGSIWVTSTPAHRDVVTFSEDVAGGIDALGGNASRFVREYMRARDNPQRAGREIAGVLAARMNEVHTQWLVLDDYHELAESPEVDEMVTVLRELVTARFLVASRVRPGWATTRRSVYGEVTVVDQSELAMTEDESSELLGRRPEMQRVASQAQGWPAVLALAAGLDPVSPPADAMPGMLHRYIAEELFQSASEQLRDWLVSLALLPALTPAAIEHHFGCRAAEAIAQARDLGFISGEETLDLHPLLREFLLVKLRDDPAAQERVRDAIDACLESEAWDRALELVLRFNLLNLVDPVLGRAFKPLTRNGRLGTLSLFIAHVRNEPGFRSPAVDVTEAEVAMRDGKFELALALAARVQPQLADDHVLKSRSNAISGQCHYYLAAFPEAVAAWSTAKTTAQDDPDEAEALYGLACAKIYGRQPDASQAVNELAQRRHESPRHLLRFATAELVRRTFGEGLRGPLGLDEPLHALAQVEDPRARSAFTYTAAHSLAQRAEYRDALKFLKLLSQDIEAFDLEFALPHANWTAALINLGLRNFGEADRFLQLVERSAEQQQNQSHALNARTLRARLLVQTGQPHEALEHLNLDQGSPVFPSWRAEYFATQAVVLACLGEAEAASAAEKRADATSSSVEVRTLAACSRAIGAARAHATERVRALAQVADQLGVWDPVVCALRSSSELADAFASTTDIRPALEKLYERSNDRALARRAGFRTRTLRSPDDVLSPRELEVLGLVAQGLRNKEIAAALYIAESTTKVHVRHVLEKLGVRTRAEAVARFAGRTTRT